MKHIIAAQDLIKNIQLSLKEASFLVNDLHSDADIEVLHQFRVKLRKSRGILQTFDSIFTDDYTKLKKNLKRVMKPTNSIRDNDVFIEYIKESSKNFSIPELASVGGIYEILAEKKEKFYQDIDKSYLTENLTKLLKKLKKANPASEIINFTDLKKKFKEEHRESIELINENSHEDDFHEIRISLKALRYTLESFSEITKEKDYDKQLKKLKKNQNSLGLLQDAAVQLKLLENLKPRIGEREELSYNKLLEITEAKKKEEMANFLANKEALLKEVFDS